MTVTKCYNIDFFFYFKGTSMHFMPGGQCGLMDIIQQLSLNHSRNSMFTKNVGFLTHTGLPVSYIWAIMF